MEPSSFVSKQRFLAWILLSGVFFLVSIGQPLGIFGDGLEYIVQTQSFIFDQSISIDTHARAEYWNETNPFEKKLVAPTNIPRTDINLPLREGSQAGGGFGSLYPSSNGKYFYVHSWIYSLVCVPFYLVLSFLSRTCNLLPTYFEYRSFAFLNSVLLAAVFAFGIKNLFGIAIAVLLILSPLGGYLSWTTPEVFQFSLLAIAFSRLSLRNTFLSAMLVGLAGAQNFPVLAFFLPLGLLQLAHREKTENFNFRDSVSKIGKLAPAYIIASIIGFSPWLIYQINFGTPNLIVSLGQASLENCNFTRLSAFLFGPLAGVLWFFPIYFFLTPVIFLKQSKGGQLELLGKLSLILVTLSLCYLMTGMVNFQSQQLGCPRYAAWIFAPVAGLLLSCSIPSSNWAKIVTCIGGIFSIAVIFFYNNFLFLTANHTRSFHPGSLPAQAQKLYRIFDFYDDPEVIYEQIQQKEILFPWEFDSRYEVSIGDGQALCLVSLRSIHNGKAKFLPKEELCQRIKIPDHESGKWLRSPVLGGYFWGKAKKP